MTYRDEVTVPPCPACDASGHLTAQHLRHLGAYECSDGLCATFYSGTTTERERYRQTRQRRQEATSGEM